MKLWYSQPASIWNEALPIGNGLMGGMLYGGFFDEQIDLNEGTLWSGAPREKLNPLVKPQLAKARKLLEQQQYFEAQGLIEQTMLGQNPQAFQPLGTLRIKRFNTSHDVGHYWRELNLETGTYAVNAVVNGVLESREAFASYPDHIIAYRWSATSGVMSDMLISLESPHPHSLVCEGSSLKMLGQLPTQVEPDVLYDPELGLRFCTLLHVQTDGGTTGFHELENALLVQGAKSVTVFLTAASNFQSWNLEPKPNDPAPMLRCSSLIHQALTFGWEALKARHTKDYQALFNRVKLELGSDQNRDVLPTNLRLERYGQGEKDLALEVLYFQFGRYLLIVCSRLGGQAANLQGIWNKDVQPPWLSEYTININTQMNYWLSETCALAECSQPLFELLEDLSVAGSSTAAVHYGCRGWTAHHNTDLWRMTTPTHGNASWAFFPLAGAWLARQMWEHYLFGLDKTFLIRAWTVLSGATRFLLDWLVTTPNGRLGTSPSTSPENLFFDEQHRPCAVSTSSSIDLSISRDLLTITLEAARILEIEPEFQTEIETALHKLEPLQIGSKGQLLEWSEEFPEVEPGHRHVSHLYGLYPANLFNPEERAASRESLRLRLEHGGGHTGWSAAWITNLYARLEDEAGAYKMLRQLIGKSTLPNLFDNHPPFQIDGNFGGSAAIAQMLLQNHDGVLRLLPALPKAWESGTVQGLRAQGGLEVDMTWQDNTLVYSSIFATHQIKLEVVYANHTQILELAAGQSIQLDAALQELS
jgi:alpha-L-fucosidase 2